MHSYYIGSGATQAESCPYGDTIDSAVTAVWREAEEMPHSNGYETLRSGTYKGRPSRGLHTFKCG